MTDRYRKLTSGGGFKADDELLKLLNALPTGHRVTHIQAGRYGEYHGLDEEYEHGYMVIVDTWDGFLKR